ncbi:MAG: polysaccharide biosynthesis C-terminal domain-containing protein [Cytophagaceae bacterium]|jgi:O-antigen/teichoic acid export membrane protein|nr:polysaccharide biosynthesis C-terminal domain-containing protein [Cytophagaceae bacterium]
MSGGIKRLAGETMIYGASTMFGRLLNWLLMPFYIHTISQAENGIVFNLYGYVAILFTLFTYGMETGFFRFARGNDEKKVFHTSLFMLGITSLLLILITALCSETFSNIQYGGKYRLAVIFMGIIIALDAFLSIPFANLRLHNRPIRFSIIKFVNIGINIFFNLFFLLFIPLLIKKNLLPAAMVDIYNRGNGVFYIVLSNLIASISIFFFFIGDFKSIKGSVDMKLVRQMLKYSWPVLAVGVTGMVIQNSDNILIPQLIKENGFEQLGVYGAAFKIGVLMSLFTQSFRFAFEPYFFKNRDKGKDSYAKIMEYFVFFGVLIFLGVTLFTDVIYLILKTDYYSGKILIPIVLTGFLLFGIYYNLSLWYKLTDKTVWASLFGAVGMAVTLMLHFILIPLMGILGAAISFVSGYFVMVIWSFFKGQKVYHVPYNLRKIGMYVFAGIIIYFADYFISFDSKIVTYLFKAGIFAAYILFFLGIELKQKNKKTKRLLDS